MFQKSTNYHTNVSYIRNRIIHEYVCIFFAIYLIVALMQVTCTTGKIAKEIVTIDVFLRIYYSHAFCLAGIIEAKFALQSVTRSPSGWDRWCILA